MWRAKATGRPTMPSCSRRRARQGAHNGDAPGGAYEVRTLKDKFPRPVKVGRHQTDLHELLQLPNSNWLRRGLYKTARPLDARPFGGVANATVAGVQVQELTPSGKVVWKWNSPTTSGSTRPARVVEPIHIAPPAALRHRALELGRAAGKYYLLSFRHLDAVYEISRKTGKIACKLGGTPTSRSLKILNDPQGSYPFAGQHDAACCPTGRSRSTTTTTAQG